MSEHRDPVVERLGRLSGRVRAASRLVRDLTVLASAVLVLVGLVVGAVQKLF